MKGIIKNAVRKQIKKMWDAYDASYTRYELTEKHLTDAMVLPTRSHLLDILPKNGIVAEIGVDKGDFSENILQQCSPEKLYLIDVWATKRYNKEKQLLVEKKFSDHINRNQVEIKLGLSTEVVDQFENQFFDWIYIDTDHTYKTTIDELNMYAPKVKAGGIIAGHDFEIGNWNSMRRYGVKEAVIEFCFLQNWKIHAITFENSDYASFAIKKI